MKTKNWCSGNFARRQKCWWSRSLVLFWFFYFLRDSSQSIMNVTFSLLKIFFCLARAQIAVQMRNLAVQAFVSKNCGEKIRECSTNPLVMCLISTTTSTTIFGIAWVRVSKRASLCLLKQSESHFPSTCFQEISKEGGSLHHHPWNKPVVYCGSKLNRSCPCRFLPSNISILTFLALYVPNCYQSKL